MRMRWGILVVGLAALAAPADALVLCAAKSKKTGEVKAGAVPRVRAACKTNEIALDPDAVGIRGPAGPQGPEGPAGPDRTGTTLRFVPGDGTPAANGADLIAALAAIGDASAEKPYTVHLAPGIYDVGAAGIDLPAFVDLEGSGTDRTVVSGSGSSDGNPFDGGVFGTVRTAGANTLRQLTVRNTGGAGTVAVGVLLGVGRSRLEQMSIEASGGDLLGDGSNIGVAPVVPASDTVSVEIAESRLTVARGAGLGRLAAGTFIGSFTIRDSTIVVEEGGAGVTGDLASNARYLLETVTIDVRGGGVGVSVTGGFDDDSQLVRNCVISVRGGTTATGVGGAGSGFRPTIEGTTIRVSDGASLNLGIRTNNGRPLVLASRIFVAGTNATAVRLGSSAFAGLLDVSGSILSATRVLESFENNASTVFQVRASQLRGTTLTSGTGTFVCRDSYDQFFGALTATCES